MDVRQPLRLFDPGGRRVEGGHLIAAFCQKDRVLSFPAADLQKAQRPGWVKTLQKLQTHLIRPGSPVIALRLIAFLVGGDPFFPGNVPHQRVDIRLQQPGQPGKLGDIGQRLGVFPFGHRLRGKVQPAGELLLGVALRPAETGNVFCKCGLHRFSSSVGLIVADLLLPENGDTEEPGEVSQPSVVFSSLLSSASFFRINMRRFPQKQK